MLQHIIQAASESAEALVKTLEEQDPRKFVNLNGKRRNDVDLKQYLMKTMVPPRIFLEICSSHIV